MSRAILTLYIGKMDIRFEKEGCCRLTVLKKKTCKQIKEITSSFYNKFMAGSELGYPALAEEVPFRKRKVDWQNLNHCI